MKKKLWNFCRRVLSILLNLAVVWMEPTAARLSWEAVGTQMFTFYTENSNFFTAGVCLLMALFQLKALLTGREIPLWVKRLKFIATCCLTMTFMTVVLVLAPYCQEDGGVVFLLTASSMLYHHLLNPLCAFVSLVFLEREPRLSGRNVFCALIPTLLYGSIAVYANVRRWIAGPYPFLLVYEQSVRQSAEWLAAIVCMNLFYAWLVWKAGGNGKKKHPGLLFRKTT